MQSYMYISKRSMLLSMLSVGRRGVVQKFTQSPNSDCNALGAALPNCKIVEGKVSWSAKVKPLFHSGKDDERILFCQMLLIWKEAVAFPHLLLDRPRDLAILVFEVCKVDVDALLERADIFFSLFWSTAVGSTCLLGSSSRWASNDALSALCR